MSDYCIVSIKTIRVLYAGESIDTAASYLEPGTCYGTCTGDGEDAERIALARARQFRGDKRCLRCGRWFCPKGPENHICDNCNYINRKRVGPGKGLEKYIVGGNAQSYKSFEED